MSREEIEKLYIEIPAHSDFPRSISDWQNKSWQYGQDGYRIGRHNALKEVMEWAESNRKNWLASVSDDRQSVGKGYNAALDDLKTHLTQMLGE